jgi:O-antigen/teichoic acid export membrane protein
MRKSVLALYVGRLVSAGTTLLLLAVVGRLEGSDGLGVVGVGMSVGALLAAITEQGASMLVVRALSAQPDRARQLVGGLTLIRAIAIPVGLAPTFALLTLVFPNHALEIWLVAAWLVVQQATELTRAVLVWADRASLSGLHTSVENIVWVGAITTLLVAGAGLRLAFTAGLLILLASLLAGFVVVRIALGWLPARPARTDLVALLRDTPPFTGFVVLGQLYSRVDTLLIGAILPGGLAAAGAYFAAVRLITALEYLPDAIARAIYPNLTRAYVAGSQEIGSRLRGPIEMLLWLSVPVPFAAFLAADWGFPVLFGHEVAGYGWILTTISVFLPVRFLGYLLGIVLTTGGKQARRVLAVAIASAIVIALDVVLLPRLGLVAAVIAMASASVTTFSIYLTQVWRTFGRPPAPRAAVEPLVVALLAAAVALLLRTAAPASIAAPAALAVFAVLYVGLWMLRRIGAPASRAWNRT